MNNRIILFMLGLVMALTACEEHIEPVDLTLKVGNVYRMDGSIVPPEHHVLQDMPPKEVGVVVAVGGHEDNYSALVMSLYDLPDTHWFTAEATETDASSDTEAFNGKENTSTLLNEYKENKDMDPTGAIMATAYAEGNITGWHLPSVGEMKAVIGNRATVRRTLDLLEVGDFNNDWYLTSTVDGSSDATAVRYCYCVIMPEGRVVSELKTQQHKVRPFMIIK